MSRMMEATINYPIRQEDMLDVSVFILPVEMGSTLTGAQE